MPSKNTNNPDVLIETGNKDYDCMLGSIYEFNNEANQCDTDGMYDDFNDSDFIVDSDSDDDYGYLNYEKFFNNIVNGDMESLDGNKNMIVNDGDNISVSKAPVLIVKTSADNVNVKNNNINLNNEDNQAPVDNMYVNVASNIIQNSFPISKNDVKSLVTEIDMDSDLLLSEDIYETIYYHNKVITRKLSHNEDDTDEINGELTALNVNDDDYTNTISNLDGSYISNIDEVSHIEEKSSTYVELVNNAMESDTVSVTDSLVCETLEHDDVDAVNNVSLNCDVVNNDDNEIVMSIIERENDFSVNDQNIGSDEPLNLDYDEVEVPFTKNIVTVEKICFREQKRRSSLETNDDVLGSKSYSDSVLNRTRPSKGFKLFWWRKDNANRKEKSMNQSSKSVGESRPMKNIHNNSNTSSKESLSCYGSTDMAVFNNDLDNFQLNHRSSKRYDKSKKHSGLNPCCVG